MLMRIICCVHAADEHWMHHLSCTARIATVCSRLRYVQLLQIAQIAKRLLAGAMLKMHGSCDVPQATTHRPFVLVFSSSSQCT